jgi:UDPglucose 6-dehydrogenase
VPVGTNKFVDEFIQPKIKKNIKVIIASNPEFLKEGEAINDFKKPDRIIIGNDNEYVKKISKKAYAKFIKSSNLIFTDPVSAEIIKYASNALLATRIAFINEIARMSDYYNGNIHQIKHGISTDKRIGKYFLNSGLGFGGSCFPKDLDGLINGYRDIKIPSTIPLAVKKSNSDQVKFFAKKIISNIHKDNKGIMVWGAAFKAETDDVRESPSIKLIKIISKKYKKIYLYDSLAKQNAKKELASYSNIVYVDNKYESLSKCNALVIATESKEFKTPDYKLLEKLIFPIIFDGRNILNKSLAEKNGFQYHGIGI